MADEKINETTEPTPIPEGSLGVLKAIRKAVEGGATLNDPVTPEIREAIAHKEALKAKIKDYNPLDEALRELHEIVDYWERNLDTLSVNDNGRYCLTKVKIKEIESHIEAEGVANAEYYEEVVSKDPFSKGGA